MVNEFKKITQKIRTFRDERDWMQFHNHKDMALSMVIEASEVLEHFQWKSPDEVTAYAEAHKDEIAEEIADVALYLFELADNLGIDLAQATEKKLKKNAQKYPVHKAKGIHLKYNKLI